MGIFQPYNYKQRSILILLPLMLLAICTWALNPINTPELALNQRDVLLLAARIFFPGLFAIAVALVVPTFDRLFQLTTVTIVYVLSLLLTLSSNISVINSPIICVLSAVSTLLAMLPYSSFEQDRFAGQSRRLFLTLFFVVLLPVVTLLALSVIVKQFNIFILYTLEDKFGEGLLSVIYVPMYLMLQSVGLHDLVGHLITFNYKNNMVTAFVNTIIVCNIFALPATIFFRSLFTKKHINLFLTLLVVVCILTSSIGACVSLILLLLVIFYPGAFGALLITSMSCFLLSYYLHIPAITSVENLYLPDVNFNSTREFFTEGNHNFGMLAAFAVIVPCIIIELSMVLSRENLLDKKRKIRSINRGYTINANSSPELTLLAFLRALGGISNIVDVEEDGSWIYIQVINNDQVSFTALNTLGIKKLLVDNVNNLYLCDVGDQSHFLHQRLSKFIENSFTVSEKEVALSTPFNIEPMPYAKKAQNKD
ncbi:hypothetical protein MXE38_01910 [Anaerobiospirillum sp. NML120448]|uniref:hypothetical protein n=1 Tax=Anaerobiospirillum sp. NML120448 TaxID=2932816 RepID=UPI001FF5667A|nr:hypothetical protein [Anaerobiospirillum sp. NML120448]MCK0513632.1 hypothetical protein [Anaerobiospirillum sp. NML120448]